MLIYFFVFRFLFEQDTLDAGPEVSGREEATLGSGRVHIERFKSGQVLNVRANGKGDDSTGLFIVLHGRHASDNLRQVGRLF